MSRPPPVQFHEWIFEADFTRASSGQRPAIDFTRQEQTVLARLAQRPGQLITREQLVDALDPNCDGIGERSVDFVVNRLRRKLGDAARKPRFIATRYGEGYVWLAKGRVMERTPLLLAIESFYGLSRLSHSAIGTQAMHAFARELGERLGWDRLFLSLADLPRQADPSDPARFHVVVSLVDDATHLHLALGIRDGTSGPTLQSLTRHLPLAQAVSAMPSVAADLVSALWSLLALEPADRTGPTQQPLHLQLHEAALWVTRTPQYWLAIEEQIVRAREHHPDDARLRVVWATTRHARLLLSFDNDEASTTRLIGDYQQIIETEILPLIPTLSSDPAYALAVAMLLLTLSGDHDELAESLIDGAFWNDAPFAAVFALKARLHLCRGELTLAISYLDRALEMSTEGRAFNVYLRVLKIKALIAGDDRAAALDVATALYSSDPKTFRDIGLQAADPRIALSEPLRQALLALGADRIRQLLRLHYYIVVRPMKVRAQQIQLMLGPLSHARRLFGDRVISDEISAELPELLSRTAPVQAACATQ